MHTDHITCEDVHRGPTVTSRVFHWEHLPPEARDCIEQVINDSIEYDIPKNLPAGNDIIEAEVVVQVTIHTQVAEY